MSTILIKNATIVTMNDKILNGDIFIEDNRIKDINRQIDVEADKVIDAHNRIVMPGFVNTYSKAGTGLFRGLVENKLPDGSTKLDVSYIESTLSKDESYISSMSSLIEMIKSGTTCINDVYINEDETAKAMEQIGIRGFVSNSISCDSEKIQKQIGEAEILYKYCNNKADGRIKVLLGVDDILHTSPENLRQIVEIAKKLNIPINANYLENKSDKAFIKEQYNQSTADYLRRNNVFDVKLILINAVWADELDLTEFQFHDVSIASNPISNCLTGSGISDMKFFIEGGINVSLGTDRIENCGTLDMFSELRNCAYTQKALYKTSNAIQAKKILEMGTIKGAKTLGIAKEVGTIEIGKKADLIIVDVDKIDLSSSEDIYSNLVYLISGKDVLTTIIDGKIIMEDRKLLTVNEEVINSKVKEIIKLQKR